MKPSKWLDFSSQNLQQVPCANKNTNYSLIKSLPEQAEITFILYFVQTQSTESNPPLTDSHKCENSHDGSCDQKLRSEDQINLQDRKNIIPHSSIQDHIHYSHTKSIHLK